MVCQWDWITAKRGPVTTAEKKHAENAVRAKSA